MSELFETRELDSRRANGLTVTLWWVKNTMETFVTVLDTNTTPPIEHHIDTPPDASPNDVFTHPFAYFDH